MRLSHRRARVFVAFAALMTFAAAGAAAQLVAATTVAARPASATSAGRASAATRGTLASVTPAFRRWLDAGIGRLPFVSAGRGLGHAPSPLAAPTAQPSARIAAGALSLLSDYGDHFDLSGLTPSRDAAVDDQGDYGTCWAFASIGSVESNLLPGETWNFSEDNVILNSGFDDGGDPYNYGGWAAWTAAYLLRWAGPLTAAQDAYGDGVTPAGLTPVKHLQEWLRIPQPVSPAANDVVKAAIVDYGALDAAVCWTDASYTGDTVAAYYCSGSGQADHEIDIVGLGRRLQALELRHAAARRWGLSLPQQLGHVVGSRRRFLGELLRQAHRHRPRHLPGRTAGRRLLAHLPIRSARRDRRLRLRLQHRLDGKSFRGRVDRGPRGGRGLGALGERELRCLRRHVSTSLCRSPAARRPTPGSRPSRCRRPCLSPRARRSWSP